MFVNSENEVQQLSDEKNNQKILANSGVQLYFSNVFDQTVTGKLPMIKYKLRKVLVDFGLVQTSVEIDQKLNFIKVYYRDPKATELRGNLLQRFNDKEHRTSQAVELSISLEGSLVSSPKISREVKTYSGLTKLLYQEFIVETKSSSMIDDNPFNEMRKIIQKGNLSPTVPLELILRGELG